MRHRGLSGHTQRSSRPAFSRSRTVQCQARAARYDRRKPPPPDLPSLLFDQRIVYLGMPVSEEQQPQPYWSAVRQQPLASQAPRRQGQGRPLRRSSTSPGSAWVSVPPSSAVGPACAPLMLWRCAQLVPAVTELMVAELLYLEKQGATMPIEMLINSSGTTRQDGEIVS